MNLAYLDPPYSRYFHKLAQRLSDRTGGRTVALLSSPAYRRYARGDHHMLWSPGDAEPAYEVPEAFERAVWARNDSETFRRTFSHAVGWFKERFQAEQIQVCLLFSDARPFSVAAQIAAEELGVVCLYFERGAFRMRTASLSTQGLNARFNLGEAQRMPRIVGLAHSGVPWRRREEPWLRTRFVAFMFHNALACAMNPLRDLMQHKRYHFFNYVRIGLSQLGIARHDPLPDAAPLRMGATARTVLLPLQLPTDSQFVMYSPFRHNQELIDFVVARVRQAVPEAMVLVKKHPMDVRSYELPPGARWVEGNLMRYLPNAVTLVCLNSTVGFEAAVLGKTVLCFGESFYTGHRLVVRVTKDDFAAQLQTAAERGDDPRAGRSLRMAVLRYYQAPGDVWAYTEDDIDASADIAIQHVRAAMRQRVLGGRRRATVPRSPAPSGVRRRSTRATTRLKAVASGRAGA